MFNFSFEKFNNMITLDFEYVMMIVFGVYILFYYCLCDMQMGKPDFKNILLLVGFHSAHMCIVKKFYKQGDTAIAMLLVLAPMILYKMYSIYQRKQQKEHDMKMAMIMAQLQALQAAQKQAQATHVSPEQVASQQQANPQQRQYNNLNRNLQSNQNGQPPLAHPPAAEFAGQGISRSSVPSIQNMTDVRPAQVIKTVNISGKQEQQVINDIVKQDDFSPNYNSIQSGGMFQENFSNTDSTIGVGAFDGNAYLNPSFASTFF